MYFFIFHFALFSADWFRHWYHFQPFTPFRHYAIFDGYGAIFIFKDDDYFHFRLNITDYFRCASFFDIIDYR